ncbi:hypothetical protein OsJ_29913 [Oryza sativa Japonica Group]|uniref:Uncharacterized protein n=1 Tax=Oryza sativa subsp. japonica TaxID=39947 RepID=B9G4F2_ORYSJ|nr:hypothetical protein OsJ_29913 [Oryza sativa Japonica Group]
MILPVACPAMLLAQPSSALLSGCLDSITALSFPSATMPATSSMSSFVGDTNSGTSLFLEKVTLCRSAVAKAAAPGVRSTTTPASASTGANADHGSPRHRRAVHHGVVPPPPRGSAAPRPSRGCRSRAPCRRPRPATRPALRTPQVAVTRCPAGVRQLHREVARRRRTPR